MGAAPAGAGGLSAATLALLGGDEEEEEEDAPLHNPLNLPLGWDGKPMPYWLWKLQGLNISYACQVCGGATYAGRRNFDRHFQEWRHAQGMRALGVPNTKHFHDITSIQGVQELYAKLRVELSTEAWRPDVDEEFEDSHGNVLDRRTFEDLARANLL